MRKKELQKMSLEWLRNNLNSSFVLPEIIVWSSMSHDVGKIIKE